MNDLPPYGVCPEWVEQDAIIVAWPHSKSDWLPILEDIRQEYLQLIEAIARYEPVVILYALDESPLPYLSPQLTNCVYLVEVPFNDTWVRDYGPLCYICPFTREKSFLRYSFNGWGEKFPATLDNRASFELLKQWPHIIRKEGKISSRDYTDLVLEGGGIECNGQGLALSNRYWLTCPNRNDQLTFDKLTSRLCNSLGVERLVLVDVPPLVGDDTDGHIDTLARFVGERQIAYVAPTDSESPNFQTLCVLQEQLPSMQQEEGLLDLIPLPDVGKLESEEGEILPASYANFLFLNDAILVPAYGIPTRDEEAMQTLQNLFPDREVTSFQTTHLIKWHGSIHCATMQVAKGFFFPE